MSTSTAPETSQDDDEYETEEFVVYVDVNTKSLDDQLGKMKKDIKFLGLDTEAPIMQFNNQLYKGTYENAMGTYCFFNESNRPGGIEDACFQEKPAKLHDYFGKTDKVLKMRRIFVEEKETDDNADLAEGEVENLDHLKIKKSYEDALNQFLKPGEKPPRDITEIPQNNIESASGSSIVLERQQSNEQLNANEQTLESEMGKLEMEHLKSKEKVQTETDIEPDECDKDMDPDFDPSDLIDKIDSNISDA